MNSKPYQNEGYYAVRFLLMFLWKQPCLQLKFQIDGPLMSWVSLYFTVHEGNCSNRALFHLPYNPITLPNVAELTSLTGEYKEHIGIYTTIFDRWYLSGQYTSQLPLTEPDSDPLLPSTIRWLLSKMPITMPFILSTMMFLSISISQELFFKKWR